MSMDTDTRSRSELIFLWETLLWATMNGEFPESANAAVEMKIMDKAAIIVK